MDPKIYMYLEPEDISIDALKMLWFVRLHPALNSKWSTLSTYFAIFLCCIFIALATKGILISYSSDMFLTCECLQTWILMTHIITKTLTLHGYKETIANLLTKKIKFWKIPNPMKQNIVYANCSKTLITGRNIIRLYISFAMVVLSWFDLQPLTTGLLPTGCYEPKGWFSYLTMMLWYLSCFAFFVLIGTDCLFCSFVTSLIVQFTLLANRFESLSTSHNYSNEIWKDLKELVDYHDFLLSYSKELNFVFSPVFILQFGMSIASSSVSVFIFLQPGAWTNRIKFLLYFMVIMAQTGFYCVPLEIAVNTASEMDRAIYGSKWYQINASQLKKCLSLVIIRTQKTLNFTGYGLIDMNLRTYLLICKTVFTFYTYLNSTQRLTTK